MGEVLLSMDPVKKEVGKKPLSLGTNAKFWFVNEEGVVIRIEKARDKRGNQPEARACIRDIVAATFDIFLRHRVAFNGVSNL